MKTTNKILTALAILVTIGIPSESHAWGKKKKQKEQEKQRRELVKTDKDSVLSSGNNQVLTPNGKKLVETNVDAVLSSGENALNPVMAFDFVPGLYEAGETDESSDYFVLVDNFVNDATKKLVVVLPKRLEKNGGVGEGWMFQSRPIKGGTEQMLSPLYIDQNGNLVVQAMLDRQADVLRVSIRGVENDGDVRRYQYPYLIRGTSGFMRGDVNGLKGSGRYVPQLLPWPVSDVYETENESSGAKVVLTGDTLSTNREGFDMNEYAIVPINGGGGKIAGLTTTKLDTLAEQFVSDEKFQKFAIFIKDGLFGRDKSVILLATPGTQEGQFQLELYELALRNLRDVIGPRRFDPRVSPLN